MNRREQYLQALGVDIWQARAAPVGGAGVDAACASRGNDTHDASDAPLAWQRLQAEVAPCTRCELSRTRTQTVFGVGDLHAQLLVIGEAPGADEDRQGEPFVGRCARPVTRARASISPMCSSAVRLAIAIRGPMKWPRACPICTGRLSYCSRC
jgi:DNA polymerase